MWQTVAVVCVRRMPARTTPSVAEIVGSGIAEPMQVLARTTAQTLLNSKAMGSSWLLMQLAFGGKVPAQLIKYWSRFLDESRDLAEHYTSEESIRDEQIWQKHT